MDFRPAFFVLIFILPLLSSGQSPFVASWNFEGNRGGSSNNPSVSASNLDLSGVEEAGFPNGQSGDAVSIRRWPLGGLDGGKFVEFSVTPQGYRMNITSVSFAFNRSDQGPTQVVLRSSMDGFSSNIGSSSIGSGFSSINVGQSLNDVESTVSYRIYAYSAMDVLGTIRLDNVRINGQVQLVPLPVDLVTFKAQLVDSEAELIWETVGERNASHFEVERSADAQSFTTLHRVAAAGNTRERMRYTYVDVQPLPGVGYYRLRQVDRDGLVAYSKLVSLVRANDQPQIWIHENPVLNGSLRLRLQYLQPADLQLIDLSGRVISFTAESNGFGDFVLQLPDALPTGLYFLVAPHASERILIKR